MLQTNKPFEFTYKSKSYIGTCKPGNWIEFPNHTNLHPIVAAVREHPDVIYTDKDEIFPAGNDWSELDRIFKEIGVKYTALPSIEVAGELVYINPKTNVVYLNDWEISAQVIIEFINSGTIPIGNYVGDYRVQPSSLSDGIQIGCTTIGPIKLAVIMKFLMKYYKLPTKKKSS